MNPATHDDPARRAYDAANAALDEAPPAGARAAVLAQAARAVQAQPRLAGTPAPARPRWRVPFAAAATLLVGVLAVQLATRTERETVIAEQGAAPQASAPAPAATPAATLPNDAPQDAAGERRAATDAARAMAKVAEPGPSGQRGAEPQRPAAAPPPVTESPAVTAAPRRDPQRTAPAEADRADGATGDRRRDFNTFGAAPPPPPRTALPKLPSSAPEAAAPSLQTPPVQAPAPATSPAPPAPAAAAPPAQEAVPRPAAPPAVTSDAAVSRATPRAEGQRAESAARETRATESPTAQRDEAERQQKVTAAPVARAAPRADAATLPETPQAWLERIGRLREAGRHDEADAELVKFRATHPDVRVPPGLIR